MELHLYWGDFHTNLHPRHLPKVEDTYRAAREYLDFFPVAYYPFYDYRANGLRVETWRQRREFLHDWDLLRQVVREYHAPGEFVTFLGYEWHGNRTRYGDHNVYYFDDGPLSDAETLEELYDHLRVHRGLAIPHHTGYAVGQRGKDWNVHDDDLSPFAEIYSGHGSSEGCDTPFTLYRNASMGPRVSGGTVQEGLARGYRLGIIASGDNHQGFPGVWGNGLAAVYASELTREALWESFLRRRVYGVTGDRIRLEFWINEHFLGEELTAEGPVKVTGQVIGSQALDRVELLRNNRVIHTWNHTGAWEVPTGGSVRAKLQVECGWGPAAHYGFRIGERHWEGTLELSEGRFVGWEGCFTWFGQKVEQSAAREVHFALTTRPRGQQATGASQQSIIFEVEAPLTAELCLTVGTTRTTFTLAEALQNSRCVAFLEEVKQTIREQFELEPERIENPDVFWHNAYKVKIHRAVPEAGYKLRLEFVDEDPPSGRNFYYLRVSQLNGQMAWSSPIWVTKPALS